MYVKSSFDSLPCSSICIISIRYCNYGWNNIFRCFSGYFLIFLWNFWNLNILLTFQILFPLHISVNEKKNVSESMTGFEPAMLRFEVWCVIHCATYPHCTYLLSYISYKWKYFNRFKYSHQRFIIYREIWGAGGVSWYRISIIIKEPKSRPGNYSRFFFSLVDRQKTSAKKLVFQECKSKVSEENVN